MPNRDNWETPQDVFEVFNSIYHFDIDLAATFQNKKLDRYIGPDHVNSYCRDAFEVPWEGSCWLNPPYSWIEVWMRRAHEQTTGIFGDVGANTQIVIPISHDHTTQFWTKWSELVSEIVLVIGMRIQFLPPPGVIASSNRSGTTLFVFRNWKPTRRISWLNLKEELEKKSSTVP